MMTMIIFGKIIKKKSHFKVGGNLVLDCKEGVLVSRRLVREAPFVTTLASCSHTMKADRVICCVGLLVVENLSMMQGAHMGFYCLSILCLICLVHASTEVVQLSARTEDLDDVKRESPSLSAHNIPLPNRSFPG